MRFASFIFLALNILGCSPNSSQRLPTAPTPPPLVEAPPPIRTSPPRSGNNQPSTDIVLWGMVVDPSGVCIEGATVEVVRGPARLGEKVTQTLPCDVPNVSGGFFFGPVPEKAWDGGDMVLRVSAPGYIPRDQNLAEVGWFSVPTFTLVPIGR